MNVEEIPGNPREIAYKILNEYFRKHCNLKDVISFYLDNAKLTNLNKKFVYNISKGVVRNYFGIDYFISFFSNIKLNKLDPEVLNILRLSVFQAVFLSRVPFYSIVDESVEIAKKHTGRNSANFINAVLRKITSLKNLKDDYTNKINSIRDTSERISISYSFPEWIIKYWIGSYQIENTLKMCKALNDNPVTYFNINTLKSGTEDVYEKIKKYGSPDVSAYFDGRSFGILNDSQRYLGSDLMKYGYIYVQDLSSQIAIRYFLDPCENEAILDVCCAPGGKTISSSVLMNNTGKIYAVDNSEDRMISFNENLKRTGIENVTPILADAAKKDFLENGFAYDENGKRVEENLKFDKIFIDAPCSALGTAAKNPDVKYNKKLSDIACLKNNSMKILQNCDKYLKTGGKIVFYTCTVSPEENKNLIKKFLSIYEKKYKIETIDIKKIFEDIKFKDGRHANPEYDGFFEIMPYYFGSEGATVCSLRKIS